MTDKELASAILAIVGPADNIQKAGNCMTRLRLQLLQHRDDMDSQLKKLPGVLGVNDAGDEYQIILGPGRATTVTQAFQAMLAEASGAAAGAGSGEAAVEADSGEVVASDVGIGHPSEGVKGGVGKSLGGAEDKSASDSVASSQVADRNIATLSGQAAVGDGKALHAAIKKRNATPVKLFFRRIAGIFIPMIPAFVGCGMITSILNIALKVNPALAGDSIIQMLAVMGNAIFFGLNLFVGVNAAKEFGGTPIIGGVLAAVISHPQLANITLWDEALQPGRGGVIAVVLVAMLGAWLEKRLQKLIPQVLQLFLVPLFTILVAGFGAIFVLQPVGGAIATAIGQIVTVSIRDGGAAVGFILGGTFLPMVMLGVHQAITPIHAELLASTGVNILLPVLAMAGAGQIGASFAVYFKTKSAFLKKTVAAALPVGILGVGEPLIYGVTLPLYKPFIGACIGGAFGGAVQAFSVVGATAMGISGLPLAAVTNKPLMYLAGLLTAYIVGFIATWLIGFDDPEEK